MEMANKIRVQFGNVHEKAVKPFNQSICAVEEELDFKSRFLFDMQYRKTYQLSTWMLSSPRHIPLPNEM